MPHAESEESIEEKLAIVLKSLKESANIAEICRRHGISQATYQNWCDNFFEGGKTPLAGNGGPRIQ